MKIFKMSLLLYIAFCAFCTAGVPLYSEGHIFMKQIQLTQGKFALVDDEDYEWLSKYNWYVKQVEKTNKYYAVRCFRINGKKKNVLMHRDIFHLNVGDKILVDHKDRNGLNNQRFNLRFCNYNDNARNRSSISKSKTSKYRGVSWIKESNKWRASIRNPNKKSQHIGLFLNEKDAAIAYNKKAINLFGEFANPNII